MKIDIEIYYGPIDLLVYLVRKKEVDIFDIPIAQVAEEYLDYIQNIERQDLEDAADFLLMAAILIRFKVRSLLPRTPEEEVEEKPITLMQIVEEYQKYKEIAKTFSELEARSIQQYPRVTKKELPLQEGDLTSLILAFQQLRPLPAENMIIRRQEIPIEIIFKDLKDILSVRKRLNFLDFLRAKNDIGISVTYFFAMLEIVKQGYALVGQEENFGDIYLYPRDDKN